MSWRHDDVQKFFSERHRLELTWSSFDHTIDIYLWEFHAKPGQVTFLAGTICTSSSSSSCVGGFFVNIWKYLGFLGRVTVRQACWLMIRDDTTYGLDMWTKPIANKNLKNCLDTVVDSFFRSRQDRNKCQHQKVNSWDFVGRAISHGFLLIAKLLTTEWSECQVKCQPLIQGVQPYTSNPIQHGIPLGHSIPMVVSDLLSCISPGGSDVIRCGQM